MFDIGYKPLVTLNYWLIDYKPWFTLNAWLINIGSWISTHLRLPLLLWCSKAKLWTLKQRLVNQIFNNLKVKIKRSKGAAVHTDQNAGIVHNTHADQNVHIHADQNANTCTHKGLRPRLKLYGCSLSPKALSYTVQ